MSDAWKACLELAEAEADRQWRRGGAVPWFKPGLAEMQLAAIYRWLAATEHGIDPGEVTADQAHTIHMEMAGAEYSWDHTGYDTRANLAKRLARHGITRAGTDPVSLTWDTIWDDTRLWGSTIRGDTSEDLLR